jgi:uncharacterized protein (TIGR00369 family)
MEDREFLAKMSPDTHVHLDRIKDLYSAPFARDIGIEIENISKDEVSLYVDIVPKHINSRGFVHGAVIYGLTDHTLAFCANMEEEAVGQNCNIIYHRPLREGRLISRSRVINVSRSLKTYAIDTYCNGKLISSSVCTAFRLGGKQ